jgi:hypothetical protein
VCVCEVTRVLEMSAMKAMRLGGKLVTKFRSCVFKETNKNLCSLRICYCYLHVFV